MSSLAPPPTLAPDEAPVVVDASLWVARFIPADAFHRASTTWLSTQLRARRTLISPALLLPEVSGAVARVLGDPAMGLRAARLITRLSTVRLVPLDGSLASAAASEAGNRRLRGVGAVYVALAHRLGVQLVSWDREQLTRAGAVTP